MKGGHRRSYGGCKVWQLCVKGVESLQTVSKFVVAAEYICNNELLPGGPPSRQVRGPVCGGSWGPRRRRGL